MNVSADRVDNKKGHIDGNIITSCVECNVARKDMAIYAFKRKKLMEFDADRLVWSIDEEEKDIYHKMKANIAGGPSIIFHRFAKRDKTYIRNASELNGGEDTVHLHPANYALVMKAKRAGKGVRLQLAEGEIIYDMETIQGGSFWSWIKDKAYPWLKKNWSIIKPVASAVADVAVPAVATAFGAPTAGVAARQGLKQLTGVGFAKKGGKLVKGSEAEKPSEPVILEASDSTKPEL
ncbi:hypothetical protein Poli38472_013313 [Pythium oligandrum]|uniref:Uncharacterized protein n=1 Tax=Pythium oligandrum TaxID=41045 RepID=A0A8K1C3E7_PYTOL|nr:hypothetical protein Poli38472_013313 [Pythium oligandrum]|eukprot:TMW55422.1 hypothetical protein Poli38472_013313 [Pythium oligandrum]